VKKKFVLFSILAVLTMLLSMLAFVSPASACTKTLITGVLISDNLGKYVVSQCGNQYLENFKLSGTLLIFLGTYGYGNLPSTPVAVVSYVDVCVGTYNSATNLGCYTFYEVWTLVDCGQFVGFDNPIHSTGDFISSVTGNPGLTATSSHIVVCGMGAYSRQVIDIASSNLFTMPWTGYWLTP